MQIITNIKGLGTTVSMLSVLNYHTDQCSIHCTSGDVEMLIDLINFYDLPFDVYKSADKPVHEFSDHGKFFVPYCKRTVQPGHRVGVAWVADPQQLQYIGTTNQYPYCKYHPLHLRDQILEEHNAIDLDQQCSIIEKIKLLEQCKLVIAYEGGIAHLAHTMGIPTVILPWHHNAQGEADTEWCSLYQQSTHMDSQTWFLHDMDLDNILKYAGHSNNVFLNAEQTIYNNNLLRICYQGKWMTCGTEFSNFERQLLDKS